MKRSGCCYWITGLSGAGKTSIGNVLYYEIRKEHDNVLLLDGDILKVILSDDPAYSIAARKKRAMQYAKMCKLLTDQGMIVICCTISMSDYVREWNRKNISNYIEVFLDVSIDILKKRDKKGIYTQTQEGKQKNVLGIDLKVEFPKKPDIIIKNDGRYTIKECVDNILKYKSSRTIDYSRDTKYWNEFYEKKPDIENPSLFALEIGSQLNSSGSILDLGCGNGRDSLYFHQLGLDVIGIDASESAIEMLQDKIKVERKRDIYFICDDFVRSSMIYAERFDYCYSRFSLHSITECQEDELLSNVYAALKEGGKFFIEARSIHDEIYGMGEKVGEDSYIYEDHFRRFLRQEKIEGKLLARGFRIEYSEEKRGFAPFGEMDPPIIRIIAKK